LAIPSPSSKTLAGTGLVDSLARPGGNITGSTNIIVEMAGKRLELLKQVVPRLSRVAVLGHPGDPTFAGQMRHVEVVARALKVEVFPVEIRAVSELGQAFDTIVLAVLRVPYEGLL
jgi:putative ABC transport system substrate-binding protein